jgi:hypothetical protein
MNLCRLIWCALIGIFRPRAALQAENLVLRHQLNVLRRKSPKRLAFGNADRLVFTALYRVAPGVLDALKILKPQTVIRWHRAGFRAYWQPIGSATVAVGRAMEIPISTWRRPLPAMNAGQALSAGCCLAAASAGSAAADGPTASWPANKLMRNSAIVIG